MTARRPTFQLVSRKFLHLVTHRYLLSHSPSVADPDPGFWIRCFFDPWIREEEDQLTHMITLDDATTGMSSIV
jgi:hypothetical protein